MTTNTYKDDLHHILFNEDYFIIGYYQASEFLKENDIDAFEAIEYVMEKERELFGEVTLKPEDINPEKIVNLLAYFAGEELLNSLDSYSQSDEKYMTEELISEMIKELESLIN